MKKQLSILALALTLMTSPLMAEEFKTKKKLSIQSYTSLGLITTGKNDSYIASWGTSFACTQVSGVVAVSQRRRFR